RIRRVPIAGRLDQQRYKYAAWPDGPLAGKPLDDADVARELARRFFRWAGPATAAQLAWWSGLRARAARPAAGEIGLVPLGDETERLLFPDDLEEMRALDLGSTPRVSFVSNLDNLAHLRREYAPLVDPKDKVPSVPGTGLQDLPFHAIVDRGRLV